MNKTTLLLTLMLAAGSSFGQLPSGATAPNFTAKDINGRTWNLYDILETGRPVVLDIFATWCGPCWSYHNSGALDTYYALHGPEGDAQSMVFMIEGDATTNTDCLYALPTCNSSTQGNWVSTSPYPILDNATIANNYKITYFPTIYRICTDKTVEEVGQVSSDDIWTSAQACVGQVPQDYAKVIQLDPASRTLEICSPQTAKPVAHMANFGTSVIQSMEVALKWNGTVLQTKTYTGNANVFDLLDVQFDPVTIPGPGTLSAEAVTVNGHPNGLATGAQSVNFIPAPESFASQQVVLVLKNDPSQAVDTYWAMYDEAGNILYHGGNEQIGPNGGGAFPNGAPADPSAYANNITIRDTMTIPASGCFSFQMVDARGNGMTPPGNFKLFDVGNPASVYSKVGNFGASDHHAYSRKTTAVTDPSEVAMLSLAPNPVSDVLTAQYSVAKSGLVIIQVTNATGQNIWRQSGQFTEAGPHNLELPVQDMSNGVYFLTLQSGNGMVTRRFVVAR